MKCEVCGKPVQEGQSMCDFCGSPVKVTRAIPKPRTTDAPSAPQNPAQSADPFASSAPAQNADPFANSAPAQNADPFASSAPAQSADPFASSAPAQSADPFTSSAPAQSADPFASSAPTQSADPFASSAPTQSADPFASSAPTQSADPFASSVPTNTATQTPQQQNDFFIGKNNLNTNANTTPDTNNKSAESKPLFDMSVFSNLFKKSSSGTKTSSKPSFLNRNNLPIFILIGTIAVLVIFIVVLLLSSGSSDKNEVPTDDVYVEQPVEQEPIEEKEPEVVINEIYDSRVREIINSYTNYTDFGIYVKNLNNGYEYGYGEDSTFLASAMCQVVILNTLSETVRDKNLDINDEYIYFNYMANGKEAPTSKNESGKNISLKKCIEDVAVYGDNNKSNHIVDYIGEAYNTSNGFDIINRKLESAGYYNTKINRKTFIKAEYIDESAEPNTTTPHEIANLFENLINNSNLGSKAYMKKIFKSVSNNGEAIGIKKYVPSYYDVCNVNALNSQATNNVALIEDGNTSVIVAVLSNTNESKTDIEDNEVREEVLEDLIDYILDTQFEN